MKFFLTSGKGIGYEGEHSQILILQRIGIIVDHRNGHHTSYRPVIKIV